ncbi:hypothetical protein EVAR_3099_1 [Eumeta japonica]|uniref:UMP-CMP kinase n=1 Tax=Eumeta variegata TaxID=151549 RepID=A0A4C1XJE7_EUMVA|nr:hypothetical protein EVAR_3099_1 [Eumeta japonica]
MLERVLVRCATSYVSRMVPEVVFVLGAPGAGKGTQCAYISREFGFEHLSAGDLLREERQRPGSEYGEMIEAKIREGQIVPVEVTCSLLHRAMMRSGKNRFLIDGFPRNQDNLEGWTRAMSDKTKLLFVLFFECSQELCVDRCLERGAAGSGRSDDNLDSLRKRFDTYLKDTMPIIDHYQGCVRPLSLFYSDASADRVEEKSLVPRSLAHSAQTERDESCFFERATGVHLFIRGYHIKKT